MRWFTSLLLLAAVPLCMAQKSGEKLIGTWSEPGGSVVSIAPCGDALCLSLVTLPPHPPAIVDHNNPDPALRTRALCGIHIGYGFRPTAPDRAADGWLYDPRAGKTYHGEMTLHGDNLALRGYVGTSFFGRTEHWTRTKACTPCTR